tara:strand:+ start:450 stop:806 length:357 start_codon:yes stop_codon:yes gene_type:complete
MATKEKKITVNKVVKKVEPEPIKYVVDIINVNEPVSKDDAIGQITWIAESDTLKLHIQDIRFGSDLEAFMTGDIVTSDGKGFNPIHDAKDWVLNLSNVAERALWGKWMASEARAIYED